MLRRLIERKSYRWTLEGLQRKPFFLSRALLTVLLENVRMSPLLRRARCYPEQGSSEVVGFVQDAPAHDGIRVGDTKPRVTSSCSAKADPKSQPNNYAQVG